VRRLAIVTGRPSAFVRTHLDVDELEVFGVYGLEDAFPPVDEHVRRAVEEAVAREAGAHLEDKGVSIVVHSRRCPDPDGAAARLGPRLVAIAAATGLVVLEGKRVFELAPEGGGKGDVVRRLAENAIALLVAGDDVADLDAFEVAREAERSGAAVGLVGVAGAETPGALLRAADTVVEGPEGLLRLLASL
jgi:trehalose 6-phosphate phosphatase